MGSRWKMLNGILDILIVSLIGAFAGYVIYICQDYRAHPGLYAMQAVPWYTGILCYGVFTIAFLAITGMIKLILWKKLKK